MNIKHLDITKDIINKVNERRKTLKKLNNGKSPVLEDCIYIKSPERGYIDEFNNKYLSGEYMVDLNNISDDQHYCVESVIKRNSKFLVLMKDTDADKVVSSRKVNKLGYLTCGDVWFNGVDFVKYVYIKSKYTNINRYLRDFLNNYATYSFENLNTSASGRHLSLGHIVKSVLKTVKGEEIYLTKIITADNYIIVGYIPKIMIEVEGVTVGDLIMFNSKLSKTSKKTQSRFLFLGNFKVVERGKLNKNYNK